MRRGKGQASVEYLSTYAWAFLGLIVTVGALNYFGIFEPQNYTPERCDLGSQVSCVDLYAEVSDDGTNIYLMIKNNYPRDIVIESATITSLEDPLVANGGDMLLKPARTHTLIFNSAGELLASGNKEHLTYEINYRRFALTGSPASHTIIGTGLVKTIDAVGSYQSTQTILCGNGNVEAHAGEECDPPTPIIVVGEEDVNRPSHDYQCMNDAQCLSDCTCEEIY